MLKLIQCVLAVFAMTGVTLSAYANDRYPENGKIEIYGDSYENTRLLDVNQGRFVFFRLDSTQDTGLRS